MKKTSSNLGYTGHEHLPVFNIINMNGRVYDPVVGRFMSPDNYIQAPTNTQSFNRYSYVWNNPLKYVDPSGWKVNDYDPAEDVIALNDEKSAIQLDAVEVTAKRLQKQSISDWFADFDIQKVGQNFFGREELYPKENIGTNIGRMIYNTANSMNPMKIVTLSFGDYAYGKDITEIGDEGEFEDVKEEDYTFAVLNLVPGGGEAKGGGNIMMNSIKHLQTQIKELIKLNKGKNSVVINSVKKMIRFDLAGKSHGGVSTPHSQTYVKNTVNGVVKSISRESKKAIEMTKQEIRLVRNYLNRQK